jgi:hypothetical protein
VPSLASFRKMLLQNGIGRLRSQFHAFHSVLIATSLALSIWPSYAIPDKLNAQLGSEWHSRRLVSCTWATQLAPMCGRYDNLIPRDAYAALFRPVRVPRLNFPPRYNVAPTDQIPIVRVDPRDGERELTMARWGLIPFWMKQKPKVPHINARAETVHKLPLFREAFAKRRCLIPATGFYEWQQRSDGKQPIAFVAKTSSHSPSRAYGSLHA